MSEGQRLTEETCPNNLWALSVRRVYGSDFSEGMNAKVPLAHRTRLKDLQFGGHIQHDS